MAYVHNSSSLWFYVGKIWGIKSIIPLQWILYCNLWCPDIRNSKMQRFTYFVKTGLFLRKSSWGEGSIGEFFLNMQKNQFVYEKSVLRINRSLNIPLKPWVTSTFSDSFEFKAFQLQCLTLGKSFIPIILYSINYMV